MASMDRRAGGCFAVAGGLLGVSIVVTAVVLLAGLAVGAVASTVGYLGALVTAWLGAGLVAAGVLVWRTPVRRSAVDWAREHGGAEDLDRAVWPWTDDASEPDDVDLDFAVRAVVHGLPVVVGEIRWRRDALGGAADRPRGRGIVAVVALPAPYPDTAVQRRRRTGRGTGDAFGDRFRIVADDLTHADRLTAAALKDAHTADDIPPWTVRSGELYAVVRARGYLSRRRAAVATARLLRVGELVGAVRRPH